MSGNTPNISRDSYAFEKMYDKVILQQGVPITDCDWNEQGDLCQMDSMLSRMYSIGDGVFPAAINGTSRGYIISESSSPTNNFTINAGWAMVGGVLVPTVLGLPPTAHDYEDDTNYICAGTVGSIDGVNGRITDDDKNWQSFHNLTSCRVKMTSGAESGNEFTISALFNATTVTLSGGIGSIGASDTYLIKPPVLTTPGSPPRSDYAYLMVWFEDINENEDLDLLDPSLSVEPSHRRERRWCVRVAEGISAPTTPDAHGFNIRYLTLATIVRTSGDIVSSEISNTCNSSPSLSALRYGSFIPGADDSYDLGSATYEWKDLYIDGTATIDTLVLSTVIGEGVASAVVPTTDDAYDLGSYQRKWKDLYLDGTAYIDFLSVYHVVSTLRPDASDTYDLGSSALQWKKLYLSDSVGMGMATDFVPDLNATHTLGNDSYRWKELWLSESGGMGVGSSLIPTVTNRVNLGAPSYTWSVLYLSTNGGTGVGTSLMPVDDATLDLGSASYKWDALYVRDIILTGVNGYGIGSDLLPKTGAGAYTLGNSSYRWGTFYGYAGSDPALDIAGSGSASAITVDTSGSGSGLYLSASGSGRPISIANTGTGVGAYIVSTAAPCLVLQGDQYSPEHPPLRILSQDTEPSGTPFKGDIYVTSAGVLMIYTGSSWTSVGSQS